MSDINEKIKNLKTDDDSKVQVVIKKEDRENLDELNLLHIFVNMKQKGRIYAWLIVLCMLVGLAAPMLMSELAEKTEDVTAVITFEYPGGEKLLVPGSIDDTKKEPEYLDLNYIASSYILQNAINKTKLSKNISASALAANIKLEKLLTDATRQELEVMSQVLDADNKLAGDVKEVTYNYENQIIITLSNGFGSKKDKKKTYLDGGELSSLLNSIADEYSDYFFDTYSTLILPNSDIANLDMASMDYIERLDSMLDVLNTLEQYCRDPEKEEYLNYRSKMDGMSFADICDCIKLVKDIDVDYLYAYVYFNCIAMDRNTTVTKYEYSLRNAMQAMKILNENIDTNANVIANYKNDNILVASTEGDAKQLSTAVTDYYNELILKQAEYYVEQSDTQTTIDNLNDKISGFKNSSSSATQLSYVENELDSIYNICCELYKLTVAHASEIIDSDFYRNSYLTIIGAQYDGESFMSAATVKKAAIGAVVGAVLAAFIWCFDGLVMEFKINGKKREEYEARMAAKRKAESGNISDGASNADSVKKTAGEEA